ncbi:MULTISPECIES: SIR2 family protein [Acinetobacter]|uniref:SIR2 family protein n=1 Tax=Acinetobacter TaxID=469 RepID=UPI001F61CD3F|nr:SIR2 family protein [Acinetobacter sp. LUNF3]UNT42215.1 SIR2 family protein [Acinetobacter sp. LUNF3]
MSFNVKEVAQLLKQAKENEKPYVFFTGAGCSVRADVPTATELIQEICKKFPIQVKNIDPKKDKFNYGKYMSALDKSERRELLKPHIIDNKKINWAHIALACLMQSGYIQRVLTFNFDSILSRACNLLGLHPSIYDFATANPHLYHLINDPSIVHLHGQGTGFVQLNTQEETLKHTEQLGDFIASTLNSNPSLFIGYSGNADEFFPLLEKKYSEQHRLIWTGRKENIDQIEAESVKGFLKKNNNLTHYIGGVDADDFLIQLAKELDCFPPQLFLNPYNFLEKQLQVIQPYPLDDGLDMLSNLSKYLKRRSKNSLTNILYTSFIHKYPSKDSTQHLTVDEIDDVMWAYDKQAWLLHSTKKAKQCFALYEKALNIEPNHFGCLHNYGLALWNQGEELKDAKLISHSLEKYTKALDVNNEDSGLLQNYAHALNSLGELEKSKDNYHKAWEIYMKLLDIDEDTDILGNYCHSLLSYANTFNDSNIYEKSKYYLELYIEKNQDDPSALVNYGFTLYKLATFNTDMQKYQDCLIILEKLIKLGQSDNFITKLYVNTLIRIASLNNDEKFYEKAFEHLTTLIKDDPYATYDLACYYSVRKRFELAKKYLLDCELNGYLPKSGHNHLVNDEDLSNLKNEQWFIELLERLKEKELKNKAA